jgi:beta-lactamase regulating signal transducer with metallopeptidase domain
VSGAPAFAADLLVRSSLLILLAALAVFLLRRRGASAAMRHLVWLSAIAALLLMPLLGALLPALPLPILPEVPAPPLTLPDEAVAAASVAEAIESEQWPLALTLLYGVVALALLARLGAAWSKLARIWNHADPADAEWNRLLSKAGAELGLKGRVRLRIARGPAMPMTWGTRAPRVLLPAQANSWSDEQKRLVLLHELAHVGRRDSLSQTAACLACALYWFHPGAWFAARQLRLEQEHAADDLALGAGARPRSYAQNLLALAGTLGLPAPAMARASQLERRLLAIVGPASRRSPGGAFTAIAAAAAAGAAWLVATAVPVHAVANPRVTSVAQLPAPVPPAPPLTAAQTIAAPAPVAVAALSRRAVPTSSRAEPRASAPRRQLAAASNELDPLELQIETGRRRALERQERIRALEAEARANGDDRLAQGLAAQREAYAAQVEAYASQRRVLGHQRQVLAEQRQIRARNRELLRRRAEAQRLRQSPPALQALPSIPAMPAIPAIPALPARPSEPRSPT